MAEFYRLILFRFFNRERGLASPEMEMAGSGGSDVRWCGDLRQWGRGSRGESPEHDVGCWFAFRWLLDVAGVGRNYVPKRRTKNSCSGCEFSKENRVHKMSINKGKRKVEELGLGVPRSRQNPRRTLMLLSNSGEQLLTEEGEVERGFLGRGWGLRSSPMGTIYRRGGGQNRAERHRFHVC